MIIWRGYGVLALIVAAICNVAMEQATDGFYGIPEGFRHYREAHGWVWFVGMWASAVGCWFLGRWLEARELKSARVVTDKETGQDLHLIGRNDMFWIPVKWWSIIWALAGVWFAMGK